MATQKIRSLRKRGHVTCFWKAFDEGFLKQCHKQAFVATKKNWLS
jgi:hypothetical protein